MRLCETCGADISFRRRNARYCSHKCKMSKPANGARTCAICGGDLSSFPRKKYCPGECAKIAHRQRHQEWRADPENHERERLSRNARQNEKYQNAPEFREKRRAASNKTYWSDPEKAKTYAKAHRAEKAQDPEWVEKNRARKHTDHYHQQRNTRYRERYANDADFNRRESTRNSQNYVAHAEWWETGRENHKVKYNSDPEYREINRDYNRKFKFGLPPGAFAQMVSAQGGRCAICGEENQGRKNLAVDHNHDSGQVRSLLCDHCNWGIGNFGEDPQRMLAAVYYLNRPASVPKDISRFSKDPTFDGKDIPCWDRINQSKEFRRRKNSSLKIHDINLDQYEWLLAKGGGVCWICLQPEQARLGKNGNKKRGVSDLSVDHDHATCMIRGLLCQSCNFGIGDFRDNGELLKEAAAYVAKWNGDIVQLKLLPYFEDYRPGEYIG